jgi:hypothetical protein
MSATGGVLGSLFSGLGSTIASSPEVQQATDQATQAFYVVAGQLVIIILLQTLLLARLWHRG